MSEKRFVYVGGFDESVTKDIVHALFIPFGDILDIEFPLNHENKANRGYAVVEYELIEDAEAAIENMNNSEYNGKVLTVNVSKSTFNTEN